MTSDAHPYSRELNVTDQRSANYIRNSVKATVNAYTGATNLYVFDPDDVLVQAYSRLFPKLFKPASAMPTDIRAHTRYPETCLLRKPRSTVRFTCRTRRAFTTARIC